MALPDRLPLAVLPTPLVRAPRLERALAAGPIWIKRDDLAGFALAGNKARPLEFLIGEALAAGADILVATGAPGSNFCAAAAVAARVAGLDCELVHCGAEPVSPPTPMLIELAAGATLRFDPSLSRQDLDTALHQYADRLREQGRRPYCVPRGGATAVGAVGFALAARELAAQCVELGIGPSTVVVPTGSGATQAGLLAGRAGDALPLHVVGASVSRPVEATAAGVLALARACARRLGTAEPVPTDVDVRDAVGEGFGLASPTDRDSAATALACEGLLLDDTYTAKAMTLLRELAAEQNGPIVFWYTGGLPGALAALGKRAAATRHPASPRPIRTARPTLSARSRSAGGRA